MIQNQNVMPFITEKADDVFNQFMYFSETQI